MLGLTVSRRVLVTVQYGVRRRSRFSMIWWPVRHGQSKASHRGSAGVPTMTALRAGIRVRDLVGRLDAGCDVPPAAGEQAAE